MSEPSLEVHQTTELIDVDVELRLGASRETAGGVVEATGRSAGSDSHSRPDLSLYLLWQAVDLGRQWLAWAWAAPPRAPPPDLATLAVGFPPTPSSHELLGASLEAVGAPGAASGPGADASARLARALGRPVTVSLDVPPALAAGAELRLREMMRGLMKDQ